MSRDIIRCDDEEYHGLLVNTFWGGVNRGECVQFTEGDGIKGYVQMTREEAIKFAVAILESLNAQVAHDAIDPPWWQRVAKHEI